MKEYKKGDSVFFARYQPREVRRPCPVCFGKRTVRVILGDNSVVETTCDFCGAVYEGSRGWVTEYEKEPRAERVTISAVTILDGDTREVRYHSDHFVLDAENLFDTEAEALARANVLREEADKYDEERAAHGKKRAANKASWLVGYHMREAKRYRESAAHHEARAVVLKVGAK